MKAIIDWAASHARMTIVFIVLSVVFGLISYISLPKEGEPDIEIPALFVSVPAPGISAEDSERLIVKPLETRLSGLTGLDKIGGTASEGYGGISLEFDYGWNRDAILAEVREEMSQAEAILPDIVENYSINEINFSEFPIVVISVSGQVPERSLVKVAKDLQDDVAALSPVLRADLTGTRDEIVAVTINLDDLENYDLTADELVNSVRSNNQLVAAGVVQNGAGEYAIKIPSSFESPQDVLDLPVKVSGDSVITMGDMADVRLTFEDETGKARLNGEKTMAIQVVKRKGENLIDTVKQVRDQVEKTRNGWDDALKQSVHVEITMDTSRDVQGMVSQLEASVITAILLVMVAVLAALGPRSSILVGFAIPTSFLLTFVLLAIFGITISNIVMFALILAVGMLVDSAIVIVEYADQEVQKGAGPMQAYVISAKRMAWPVISSTATTLCAFLPLLLWPGIAGQFMGSLPRTIIFVLCSSLVVALIFLPVMGGVAGRIARRFNDWSDRLRANTPRGRILIYAILAFVLLFLALQIMFRFEWVLGLNFIFGMALVIIGLCAISVFFTALGPEPKPFEPKVYRRTRFGRFIYAIVSRPSRILATFGVTFLVLFVIMFLYGRFNHGVDFFAPSEPERVNLYVQARGNLSAEEKDRLVLKVEDIVRNVKGVDTAFAFSGSGGLNQNTGGGSAPNDTIGVIQMELTNWEVRYEWPDDSGRGAQIIEDIREAVKVVPGVKVDLIDLSRGPASANPINLEFHGDDFEALEEAVIRTRAFLDELGGIRNVQDSRPLPGIDVQMDIDVTEAGRFGANVASVGTIVRLATLGVTLGQMRVDSSDDEVDIVARLPEDLRLISTLETLRVRTPSGLVPIANFTTSEMVPARSQINRIDQTRFYTLTAGVNEGVNGNERLQRVITWMDAGNLPQGVSYALGGDFADQAESTAFLMQAFIGALGLMLVILLAQFNSFYSSFVVLTAVLFSTFGVLLGLMIMGQPFSVIMTGTGVLALAGIIVNNNIILIDSYYENLKEFDVFEAITRTVESRIRPILLTTGTTILGVMPMMLGISIDFFNGGYTIDAPTSLWWTPLATAIVWGLGFATFLTLIVTPTLLGTRYWVGRGFKKLFSRGDKKKA